MNNVGVVELMAELIGLVATAPGLVGGVKSVFDHGGEDGADVLASFPGAFVYYHGTEALGKAGISTDGVKAPSLSSSVSVLTHQFVILLAIQHQYAGQGEADSPVTPSLVSAAEILDYLRRRVHGYRKAAYSPWRFVAELSEPQISGDGIVFYSQVWNINTPMSNNVGAVN